jgi:MFS family permease
VQASFKPTAGGYVFRCPNPWLFGRWRSYLVNEAQKETLAVHLRQRQRLILWLMAIYLLVALGLTALFGSLGAPPDPSTAGLLAVIAAALLGMLALALVPHLYLMRKIEPLLAQMQRTDEQTTLREQIFGIAAVISPVNLALGGLGGFLIAVANIKSIAEELSEGRFGSQLLWPAMGLLIGVLLASYFAYLAVLKRRLKRKAN